MKYFAWDLAKNEKLKREREISFEDVANAIVSGKVLDIVENPNKNKYPDQKYYVVDIDNYSYIIPFVEDDEKQFLKTIFPSRKMTKKYLKIGGK